MWSVGLCGGREQWPGMVDMLSSVGVCGAWLPHIALAFGGAWMCPTPLGDVSDGVDTLLDVGAHFEVTQTQNHG